MARGRRPFPLGAAAMTTVTGTAVGSREENGGAREISTHHTRPSLREDEESRERRHNATHTTRPHSRHLGGLPLRPHKEPTDTLSVIVGRMHPCMHARYSICVSRVPQEWCGYTHAQCPGPVLCYSPVTTTYANTLHATHSALKTPNGEALRMCGVACSRISMRTPT